MGDLKDLIDAVELSAQIRDDFAVLADLSGAEQAFYVMAGHLIKDRDPNGALSEETIVKVVRAAYDDYQRARIEVAQ